MKRSIMGLVYLIQGMRSAGVDVDRRLETIGIRLDQLDPQALIHRELEWNIRQHVAHELDPFYGLLIGQHYALAGYGPFLMFLMTSFNVAEAFQDAMKYQCLTYVFGELSYHTENNKLVLIYEPVDLDNSNLLLLTNAEISGTYRFIRDIYRMMGLPALNIQTELPIQKPKELHKLLAYQDYYGEQVQFGYRQARFWIDASVLKHELDTSDPIMHEVYRQRCDEESKRMLGDEKTQDHLLAKIEDYLSLQLENIPSLSMLSKALQIPERTLRHQLSIQQTSFQKIRENLLKQKTKQLLLDRTNTIEKIAIALGYAETASFNHAFKRWYGMSPKQFQNQIEKN